MTNETTNDTDSTTGGGSSPLTHSPLWLNIAEVSFLLPVAILVLISSSIVLLVIFRTPKLHRTPGFLMLVLSSVDILIALFDQGYSIGELGGKIFDKDLQPFGIFCQLQFFTNNFLYGVQSTTIMMAAVDRVMAITRPLYYHCRGGRLGKILFCLLGGYWLVLMGLFVIMWTQAAEIQWIVGFSSCMARYSHIHFIRMMLMVQYTVAYIIPGGIILFCYVAIGLKIRSSSRERRKIVANMQTSHSYTSHGRSHHGPSSHTGTGGGTLSKQEQEVSHWQQIAICKSLILITLLYYISFLPFFLYQVTIYFSGDPIISPLYRALKAFRNLSSVTDGAIFYGMSNSFQVGLRNLIGRSKAINRHQAVNNRSVLAVSHSNHHRSSRLHPHGPVGNFGRLRASTLSSSTGISGGNSPTARSLATPSAIGTHKGVVYCPTSATVQLNSNKNISASFT